MATIRQHSSDDMTGPEFEDATEPVAVILRSDGSVDVYGYITVIDQRSGQETHMGPYCNYCSQRCFVLRVIPDGAHRGRSLLLATCQRGMAHDLEKTGHTHKTAVNPVTDPEAARRAGTTPPDSGLGDFLVQVPQHHNDLGDWCPRSGAYTADGACPLFCKHADDIMGIDAGRDEDEDEPGDEDGDHQHDGGCTWAGCGFPAPDGPDTLREARERS